MDAKTRLITRGALESAIANAVSKFHREQQGRGPLDVRAHIFGDLVLVRSTGILTQTENNLCASEAGRLLIQSSRRELRAINHEEIEETVGVLCGCQVLRSYSDLSVEAAEQVEVYVLESNLEKYFH